MKQENYNIEIQGLKLGTYQYVYNLGNSFFNRFPNSLIQNADLNVDITLEKRAHVIELNLNFTGTVELECDRSLELFQEPLQLQQKLLYKFGDEPGEVDEQLTILAWNDQYIELIQAIYDFVILSLPMKKLHPKFRDENLSDDNEGEGLLVYTTLTEEEAEVERLESENQVDSRWATLLKLKENNSAK